jgi:hypothetical protein
MRTASVEPGWHRIADKHGCRLVWAEPHRPRAGWVACYRSRQGAETGECSRALLLRADEFDRRLTERIEAEPRECQ